MAQRRTLDRWTITVRIEEEWRLKHGLTGGRPVPATTTVYSLVPVISIFFGIIVRMYYKEHEPAHFHAEHQGQDGKFDFSGKMIVGNIQSKTALQLIRRWAVLHRTELEANWGRMKAGQPLERIAPLE